MIRGEDLANARMKKRTVRGAGVVRVDNEKDVGVVRLLGDDELAAREEKRSEVGVIVLPKHVLGDSDGLAKGLELRFEGFELPRIRRDRRPPGGTSFTKSASSLTRPPRCTCGGAARSGAEALEATYRLRQST